MVGARTFGMAGNRLIDAEIDARNPRTKNRELPTGLLNRLDVLVFMAMSMSMFLLAVYNLSDWAGYTWPVVMAALIGYHYMKRFTWSSHLGLGFIYGLVPCGVWLAATNELSWSAVLLGFGAGAWAAGFDTIYSTQDIDFDRKHNLHSIPARFGIVRALVAAKMFHACTVACIVIAGPLLEAGTLYYIGAATFLGLLIYEHRLVSPGDLSKVNIAFFNMNGIISVLFFLFVITDVFN